MLNYCPQCDKEIPQGLDKCVFCENHASSFGRDVLLLDNRYQVLETIKTGAMGCVYKALDKRLQIITAVKKMLSTYSLPQEKKYAQESFLKEARILSSLHHSGIPKVSDFFIEKDSETGEPAHYLVMTYIKGSDLETIMGERGGIPIPLSLVLPYFKQILEILAFLHSQKPPIIYRDVKPSNIMIERDDNSHTLNGKERLFLIDFGIARVFNPQYKGTLIGTPAYSSPEQYKGYAEPRSDLYSLGVVLHYLLTGINPEDPSRSPFFFEPVSKYTSVPEYIDQIISSMLNFMPQYRPSGASEILELIERKKSLGITSKIPFQWEEEADPKGLSVYNEYWEQEQKMSFKSGGKGVSPLHKAVKEGDFAAVKKLALRSQMIDVLDDRGLTPLHYAVYRNYGDMVSILLKAGHNINAADHKGWASLHYAAHKNHIGMMKFLLDNGANINITEKYGGMPLHIASSQGSSEIVELLLERGCQVNVRDSFGMTPLHYAAYEGSVSVIRMLAGAGEDLEALDSRGWTPLHYAVYNENRDAVMFFSTLGADINKRDMEGNTPLHIAAYKGSFEIAKLLIESGADVKIKNNESQTPWDKAAQKNYKGVTELLQLYEKR